jgi:alanine racemase
MPVPAPWRQDEVRLRLQSTIGMSATGAKLRRAPLTQMTSNVTRLSSLRHQAWVEVDLAALAHNARVLRRAVPSHARLGILVKANGYGHGLEMAARAALDGGADQLVVATLDEGLALRRAGIDAPALVVYPVPPAAVELAVAAQLELSITGLAGGRRLLDEWRARRAVGRLTLHVEVDSGMGRGGVQPDELLELIGLIEGAPATQLAAVWSHLADGSDTNFSREQVRRFDAALEAVAATGRALPPRHMLATEGIFCATAPAYEMVRVGLAFYGELGLGVEPAPAMAALAAELRPAMAVKARAVRLEEVVAGATVGYGGEWRAERPSLVATLPIGYADGWVRAYWPGAETLVRGRRVPLIGRVSMDSVCADVTDVDGVTLDDEFVLLGRQADERITPGELARRRNTIINEVFCSFGPRLPRVVVKGAHGGA